RSGRAGRRDAATQEGTAKELITPAGAGMATEMVGWAAAAVLLVTIAAQVVKQWKDRSSAGVSPWLFAGQALASAGFTIYSLLLGNAVFAATNAVLLASAVLGQLFLWRNQRGRPGAVKKIAGELGILLA